MSEQSLLKVVMRISDPWEIGEALEWKAFDAHVVSTNEASLLIRLLDPFVYKGTECKFFVASPRHENDQIEMLLEGESLFCGMTHISAKQAESNNPFDLRTWRGGIAIIGNLDSVEPDGKSRSCK